MPTDNYLKSIFSTGGYFCLEPRTLQVLFCQCVLNERDKLGYFLRRKAPNRTPQKPEFRASGRSVPSDFEPRESFPNKL